MKIENLKRIATILAIIALLVFVSRIEAIIITFLVIGLILALIPTLVLLALTAIAASFAVKVFHPNRFAWIMFIVLLTIQSVILFLWVQGWTAASAFGMDANETGLPVIDPQVEDALMIAFWLMAALVIATIIEHLVNARLKVKSGSFGKHTYKHQILILLFEIFLLIAVNSSIVSYRRIPRKVNVPSSLSADGTREVQLVPINAWIDTNGLVIAREGHSFIWRTVGEIGDELTEASSGKFVWLKDSSQVYLLLNYGHKTDHPVVGYDFEMHKSLGPETYVERQ